MGEPEVEHTVAKSKSLSNVSKQERTITKNIYLMEIIQLNNQFNECMSVMIFHQRKFQLKMGLLTLNQIPCHHVLSNEISLNLKYCIGHKHFFYINLGIGIIKKLLVLFVFSTYLPVFLLKFRPGDIFGCGILVGYRI